MKQKIFLYIFVFFIFNTQIYSAIGESIIKELPPYPTEEEQNEVVFLKREYDAMREAFEIINKKSYKKMPSYDCNKAKTEVEKIICSNKKLSELDAKMDLLHRYMQELYDLEWEPSEGHLKWLKARNNFECKLGTKNKTDCLVSLYELKTNSQLAVLFMRALRIEKNARYWENRNGKEKKLCRYWFDLFLSQGFSVNYRGDFVGNQVDYLGHGCPVFVKMWGFHNSDYLTYALDHGADVNLRNEYCPPILFFAGSEHIDKILKMGADVNAVSGSGEPLLVARTGLAEKILPLGADPNKADKYGTTPLMSGAYSITADYLPTYIKLLIKYGADITAKNNKGKTAYDVLVETYNDPKVYEDRKKTLKLTDEEMKKYLDESKKLLRN